jgi:hypothetical protein
VQKYKRLVKKMHSNLSTIKNLFSGDKENIKIIENFMPSEHVNILLKYCKLANEPRNDEQEKEYKKAYFQRELAKSYEHLMRAEATRMYGYQLDRDRTVDFTDRKQGVLLEEHTDFIKSQFFDPLEPPIVYPTSNRWSGHMSVLIYLNDNYEGGEIVFPKQNIKIKPKSGMLIAFPGNEMYPHLVEPCYGDLRYTISLWTRVSAYGDYINIPL